MGHRSDTFWAGTRIFSFGKPVSLTEKSSYSKLYRGYSLKQQQLIFIAHQTDYKELISLRAGSRVDSQLAFLTDILFCPLLLGACSHTTKLITLPLSLPFKIQTVNTSNTLSLCFNFALLQFKDYTAWPVLLFIVPYPLIVVLTALKWWRGVMPPLKFSR